MEFLRLQSDCFKTIHSSNHLGHTWRLHMQSVETRCLRSRKHDPVGACNLIEVRKTFSLGSIQKNMQFVAKISGTNGYCFRNSEKELEKDDSPLEKATREWILNGRYNLNRRENLSSMFRGKTRKLLILLWNRKSWWLGDYPSKLNVPGFKSWLHHLLAMTPYTSQSFYILITWSVQWWYGLGCWVSLKGPL